MKKVRIGDFLFERKGRYKPNDNSYDFLNIKAKISDSGINNRAKLSKLNIGVYNYVTDDDIAHYCKSLIA